MRRVTFIPIAMAAVALTSTASAQVTVQQPVFQTFSAATTVSVPDRGSAFIGGVGSAAASRSSSGFGPLRAGSSAGSSHEHSGLSAHVYIHDFAEMDRVLLEQAGRGAATPRFADRSTQHAYESLIGRDRDGMRSRAADFGTSSVVNRRPPAGPAQRSAVDESAAKFLKLGQSAEDRGSLSVARMHYRMAAKHGSPEAAARLAGLERPVAAARPVSSTTP